MPKIKVFLWQLCHNALLSRGLLLKRRIALDPVCPSCQSNIESIEHIFKVCPMTIKMSELAVTHNWLPSIPFDNPSISLRDDLNDLSLRKSSHFTKIILTLWSIWKSRNAVTFPKEFFSQSQTLLCAKRNWVDGNPALIHLLIHPCTTSSTTKSIHSHHKTTRLIRWKLPAGGYTKLNFDSSKLQEGAAIARYVLREWKGSFITASTRFVE